MKRWVAMSCRRSRAPVYVLQSNVLHFILYLAVILVAAFASAWIREMDHDDMEYISGPGNYAWACDMWGVYVA
jgi:uncharacterized membrane protein (DUF485 family)